MTALRVLLAGIVDYAGLFPPAGLDMSETVRNYASYRASDDAWMLGRLVVPVAKLNDFEQALGALEEPGPEWHLSALLGPELEDDVTRVQDFNQRLGGRATVDVLEGKFATTDAIQRVATIVGGIATYAEIPVDGDVESLVSVLAKAGIHGKVRAGGVTSDAFPPTDAIVKFMRTCIDAQVCFKATAGLHHPLRATYRLTYADNSPTGPMFGFLNVFLAAAFMLHGASDDDAHALLEETNASAFAFTGGSIRWRERSVSDRDLRETRDRAAAAFGSCSFREPVDELRAMTLL